MKYNTRKYNAIQYNTAQHNRDFDRVLWDVFDPDSFCFGRTDGVVVATPSDAVMQKSMLHVTTTATATTTIQTTNN